ncbi:Uncharacterised protein [Vibrio cholerae]|nr:Uncharacterised protein [Vibrio cholerae]CSI68376.1 Uncharacterised protein [Vibrio cholerae]
MREAKIGCAMRSADQSTVQRNPTTAVVAAHNTKKRQALFACSASRK